MKPSDPPSSDGSPVPRTWIAEEHLVFLHPNGHRQNGRIAVGLPEQIDDVHAQCSIALDGIASVRGPVFGASPLQALLLALQLMGFELHRFVSQGGRVIDPTDESTFSLESFFGPLLRPAPPYAPPP